MIKKRKVGAGLLVPDTGSHFSICKNDAEDPMGALIVLTCVGVGLGVAYLAALAAVKAAGVLMWWDE